jgi:RimJ/RimL family protein N-acetyltransferase
MNIGTIVIETPRLILRPPTLADLNDWVKFTGDENTMQHLGGVHSPSMAWRSLMTAIGSWQANGFAMFSVIEKASQQWIGRIGPWHPLEWPGPEVGWGIHADHWRRGYAFEAAAAAMDWTFNTLHWPNIIHTISAENIASIALAEKLGSRYTRQDQLPEPINMEVGVWQQTHEQWQANRRRLGLAS